MKKNKQKGNITLILLIIAILVIIGLIFYIQKIKSRDDKVVKEDSVVLENEDKTKNASATINNIKLQNIDVQSSLVEKATGYIKSIYTKNNRNYIDIDYIIIESCMKTNPGNCPNGVSVKNDNTLIRTFELSSNVIVKTNGNNVGYTGLVKIFQDKNDYRGLNPWDVIIKDGLITDAVEHFMP